MPPLAGFSDNPFKSRTDVIVAAKALIAPLFPYRSPGCARLKLPHAIGTHFDETAAQLEGFARPLWVIASLICDDQAGEFPELIEHVLSGLESGTDPENEEYWGPIKDFDQRMVEAEVIAFTLLVTPCEALWERLNGKAQKNLVVWLQGINGKEMPRANWLWFRVFVNLALVKVCGVKYSSVKDLLQADLSVLDAFYIADGWSSDGVWRSDEIDEEEFEVFQRTGRANMLRPSRNADYYSGSFAIQFSQLLYLKFAGDLNPERTERYQQQARDFGRGFCRFFDSAGAAIPFGRSLTYRFACAGYFAALAWAQVPDMPEPLETPGAVKGFLLRHMRWWAGHSNDIFSSDGVLNLGWTYPQMYLTEDYNSPQSIYWALKTLIVIGLPASDHFWQDTEFIPSPRTALQVLEAPRQIISNHPDSNHHFLLSFAQFLTVPFKGIVAKYSKFAYSSTFGFSVPAGSGQGLAQLAPDSALALSRDGTQTWAMKYRCTDVTLRDATMYSYNAVKGCQVRQVVPAGIVTWYPWADRSVVIDTIVIPPTDRWPDWHVRLHRIRASQGSARLFTAEGGFAINGRRQKDTLELGKLSFNELTDACDIGVSEGVFESSHGDSSSILILSEQGASGIVTNILPHTTVSALKPEPNTNLMRKRTLIPLVETMINGIGQEEEIVLVTKVFAISQEANGGWKRHGKSLRERWVDQPELSLRKDGGPSHEYLSVSW
ncbi:hypothetical protein BJY04DRAFT_217076 [Aspergillus karnatakaensis]|uniref:glycoside hydrolase family 154 protein n=1 Tax=Aspergillus karnatakaensis TaxID=1810916 RepID=UPI003CCD8D61